MFNEKFQIGYTNNLGADTNCTCSTVVYYEPIDGMQIMQHLTRLHRYEYRWQYKMVKYGSASSIEILICAALKSWI
jgi:hypothetical protein